MATEPATKPHPGDIIQDNEGHLYLADEVHGWGVGAVQRWRSSRDEASEAYYRLKDGQFVVVGVAYMLPEEVAQRRRDSLSLAAELAREAGRPNLPTATSVIHHLMHAFERGQNAMERAYEDAAAWLAQRPI